MTTIMIHFADVGGGRPRSDGGWGHLPYSARVSTDVSHEEAAELLARVEPVRMLETMIEGPTDDVATFAEVLRLSRDRFRITTTHRPYRAACVLTEKLLRTLDAERPAGIDVYQTQLAFFRGLSTGLIAEPDFAAGLAICGRFLTEGDASVLAPVFIDRPGPHGWASTLGLVASLIDRLGWGPGDDDASADADVLAMLSPEPKVSGQDRSDHLRWWREARERLNAVGEDDAHCAALVAECDTGAVRPNGTDVPSGQMIDRQPALGLASLIGAAALCHLTSADEAFDTLTEHLSAAEHGSSRLGLPVPRDRDGARVGCVSIPMASNLERAADQLLGTRLEDSRDRLLLRFAARGVAHAEELRVEELEIGDRNELYRYVGGRGRWRLLAEMGFDPDPRAFFWDFLALRQEVGHRGYLLATTGAPGRYGDIMLLDGTVTDILSCAVERAQPASPTRRRASRPAVSLHAVDDPAT